MTALALSLEQSDVVVRILGDEIDEWLRILGADGDADGRGQARVDELEHCRVSAFGGCLPLPDDRLGFQSMRELIAAEFDPDSDDAPIVAEMFARVARAV